MLPIALVAYILGVFLASLGTFYRFHLARGVASAVFVSAWAAHLGAVLQHAVETKRLPLSNGVEWLLVFGLAVMTLHLFVWFIWRVWAAGVVLPAVAAVAGFGAWALYSDASVGETTRRGGLFLFHTTVSTLGMAMLVVALAMSVIYLILDRALKTRKTLRVMDRLPPLDQCDHIGFQSLAIGFLLLTIGIVTGVLVNTTVYDKLWVPGIKQTFPLLAWVVFAVVLAARLKMGLRGRRSAYLTIAGVILGLVTVVGMTP